MEPFIGEIRIFAFNYVPDTSQTGWLACDGSIYNVAQYQALYTIIGNIYGGTPQKTFAVPDLRGMAAMSFGLASSGGSVNRILGTRYGEKTVTLTTATVPSHTHTLQRKAQSPGSSAYDQKTAAPSNTSSYGVAFDGTTNAKMATTTASNTTLLTQTVGPDGGVTYPQGHDNMQPYLVLQFCIASNGIYPVKP